MAGTSHPQSKTPSASGRAKLPSYLIAFIVVDVLLVLLTAWVAVSTFSANGGGSTNADGPASPSASVSTDPGAASTDPSAPQTPALIDSGGAQVASPSGNIVCSIAPTGVRCTIASLAAEPAPVTGCDGTVGYAVELTSGGVTTPCTPSDQRPGKAAAEIPVLEYGATKTVNNFGCESSASGMKCTDTSTGHGFTLARAGVSKF